jgi:Putative prokaryotic signal transducing protein
MSLVTVETLYDAGIAELARMRLEAEGIPVLLHSMGQAMMFGGAPIMGGVRVQVPEGYVKEADILLKQLKEDLDGKYT